VLDAVRTLSSKEKQCVACPGRDVCTA
jgi:hypothetical protein